MIIDIMHEMGTCQYCNKAATHVWIYKGLFGFKWKTFCDEHARLHRMMGGK